MAENKTEKANYTVTIETQLRTLTTGFAAAETLFANKELKIYPTVENLAVVTDEEFLNIYSKDDPNIRLALLGWIKSYQLEGRFKGHEGLATKLQLADAPPAKKAKKEAIIEGKETKMALTLSDSNINEINESKSKHTWCSDRMSSNHIFEKIRPAGESSGVIDCGDDGKQKQQNKPETLSLSDVISILKSQYKRHERTIDVEIADDKHSLVEITKQLQQNSNNKQEVVDFVKDCNEENNVKEKGVTGQRIIDDNEAYGGGYFNESASSLSYPVQYVYVVDKEVSKTAKLYGHSDDGYVTKFFDYEKELERAEESIKKKNCGARYKQLHKVNESRIKKRSRLNQISPDYFY